MAQTDPVQHTYSQIVMCLPISAQHKMICAGTLICTSLLTRCMTTPQKVTKKRLVAYIDPDIYELIENDSISKNCSISKSTERILLYSMKEKSQNESQYPLEFQNIELTVLSILSNLPLEIIEKLSEQITTTPFFGREAFRSMLFRPGVAQNPILQILKTFFPDLCQKYLNHQIL